MARTLMAVVGVGCLAVTAAMADPSGLTPPAPSDVFAAGEGGLGRLETGGSPTTQRPDGPLAGSEQGSSDTSLPDLDAEGLDDYIDPFGDPFGDGLEDDPADGGEVLASAVPSGLATGDIPAVTLRAYRAAAQVLAREQPGCAIDWALLAGIGRVESDHGRYGGATVTASGVSVPAILGVRLDGSLAGTMVIRDTDGGALDGDAEYDRALGPMQFLPGTWQRWGSDGDRDGIEDPQDIDDAALAAARYLCSGSSGLDQPGPAAAAVRRYNNSSEYVQLVLATAADYRDDGPSAFPGASTGGGYDDAGYSPTSQVDPDPPGWTPPRTSALDRRPGAGTPGPVFTPGVRPTPSARPTPTATPTGTPTASPTGRPSATPAPTVTQPPTASPTRPVVTVKPPVTARPTQTPTRPPTTPPPASPTAEPTAEPTPEPTPETSEPSENPGEPVPTCDPVPTEGESAPPPGTEPTGEPCLPPCTEATDEPSPSPSDATPAPDCEDAATEPVGTPTAPPGG